MAVLYFVPWGDGIECGDLPRSELVGCASSLLNFDRRLGKGETNSVRLSGSWFIVKELPVLRHHKEVGRIGERNSQKARRALRKHQRWPIICRGK